MKLHLLVYGPERDPNILEQLTLEEIAFFDKRIVSAYHGMYPVQDVKFEYRFTNDPGTYEVTEAFSSKILKGSSNTLRQFQLIRNGLSALEGCSNNDLLLIIRSDLTIRNHKCFFHSLQKSCDEIKIRNFLQVVLNVNSVNPFSFTGHRIHYSDWILLSRLDLARKRFNIDPLRYSNGEYSGIRGFYKNGFVFGKFTAEEMFNVQLAESLGGHSLQETSSTYAVSLKTSLRLLASTRVISYKKFGLTLDKYSYMYDLESIFNENVSIWNRLKLLRVYICFTSNLIPAVTHFLLISCIIRGVFSWFINAPLITVRKLMK